MPESHAHAFPYSDALSHSDAHSDTHPAVEPVPHADTQPLTHADCLTSPLHHADADAHLAPARRLAVALALAIAVASESVTCSGPALRAAASPGTTSAGGTRTGTRTGTGTGTGTGCAESGPGRRCPRRRARPRRSQPGRHRTTAVAPTHRACGRQSGRTGHPPPEPGVADPGPHPGAHVPRTAGRPDHRASAPPGRPDGGHHAADPRARGHRGGGAAPGARPRRRP
ncbi:hypothetical protein ACFV4G_22395 [Kitasatospora sp. NPDC059747]|uniref:hypothetical protein n=1 Tax=Kitasatospora sp. NPDC059747 TaxID=3346930 RepID=UPI00365C4A67